MQDKTRILKYYVVSNWICTVILEGINDSAWVTYNFETARSGVGILEELEN